MSFDSDKLKKFWHINDLSLTELFDEVNNWQKQLGYDYRMMTPEERLKQFKNYYIAMSMEQAELLQEVPWKPWRPLEAQYKGPEVDLMKEWIDCLFFLVDQALCLRLDPSMLAKMFHAVLDDNFRRIKIGYNDTKGKL